MGNPLFYDTAAEAAVNAVAALVNGGTLVIYTDDQPALDDGLTGTLLATLDLSATAFADAAASAGTVTAEANAISAEDASATGTAGYFALLDSDGDVQATGTCGTEDADLNLSTTSLVEGVSVSVTSLTLTLPQSGG